MGRWPYSANSAALVVARVAWPFDSQVAEWSPKMLTDPGMREVTIRKAREQFEAAVAEIERGA